MNKLTELFKQHGLSLSKERNYSGKIDREALAKIYGDKLTPKDTYQRDDYYAYIKCDNKCTHWLYASTGNTLVYSWPGQSYLVSKVPLSLDLLHELTKLKNEELEAARKKRFEKIKTPRDAVRVTFRDLGIEAPLVGGVPRLDCGPFDMQFSTDEENPQCKVTMVYRSTNYVHHIDLTTLTIADPGFNKKVEALAFNGKNLSKLLMGEIQPKPVEGT